MSRGEQKDDLKLLVTLLLLQSKEEPGATETEKLWSISDFSTTIAFVFPCCQVRMGCLLRSGAWCDGVHVLQNLPAAI